MNKSQQSAAIKEMIANQPIPAQLTWPAIIAAFFIFWPVSMFLLWKRINTIYKTALGGKTALKFFGWLSIIASIVLVLATPKGTRYLSPGQTYFFIAFFAGGIGLIILDSRIIKFITYLRIYTDLILDKKVTSINEIAANLRKSYGRVERDLQKLIDMGLFAGAYIDRVLGEIILPEDDGSENVPVFQQGQERREGTVTCKGCGAVNRVVEGRVAACEFCGSPISGD